MTVIAAGKKPYAGMMISALNIYSRWLTRSQSHPLERKILLPLLLARWKKNGLSKANGLCSAFDTFLNYSEMQRRENEKFSRTTPLSLFGINDTWKHIRIPVWDGETILLRPRYFSGAARVIPCRYSESANGIITNIDRILGPIRAKTSWTRCVNSSVLDFLFLVNDFFVGELFSVVSLLYGYSQGSGPQSGESIGKICDSIRIRMYK